MAKGVPEPVAAPAPALISRHGSAVMAPGRESGSSGLAVADTVMRQAEARAAGSATRPVWRDAPSVAGDAASIGRIRRSAVVTDVEARVGSGRIIRRVEGEEGGGRERRGAIANSFTIAVKQENEDLLDFVKLRAKSKFRNEMRKKFSWMPGVRKAKTNDEMKKSSAARVVKAKAKASGTPMSRPEELDATRRLAAASGRVGHTWVELDRDRQLSYGLFPANPGRPDQTVPGSLKNPDPHRDDGGVKRITYPVTPAARGKLTEAIRKRGAAPRYNMMSENCTTFAKDMAEVAGVSFPSAATTIPYGPLGVFKQQLWNPNQLYADAENSPFLERDEEPEEPSESEE